MASIFVCVKSSCASKGAYDIIRDIEELSWGKCNVEESGCLGSCRKGPSLEVQGNKIVRGCDTFSKLVDVVADAADVKVAEKVRKLGKIKFDLRRQHEPVEKCTMLAQAFGMLGATEDAAAKAEPRLTSELLVIRSQSFVKTFLGSSIKDAEFAIELNPRSAQAHLALGNAYELGLRAAEAITHFKTAIEIGSGVNASQVRRQIKRCEHAAEQQTEDSEIDDKRAEAIAKVFAPVKIKEPKAKRGEADAKSAAPAAVIKTQAPRPSSRTPLPPTRPPARADAMSVKAESKAKGYSKQRASKKKPFAQDLADELPPVFTASVDWIDWKIEEVKVLNHDCLSMKLHSLDTKATSEHKFDSQEFWHVDIMKESVAGEHPLQRAYTPVSNFEDYRKGSLEIMLKVYPDGRMTSYLAKLNVGDLVTVSNPQSTARPEEFANGIVFVAGGSAVTVAIQFCDAVLRRYRGVPVHLVLCIRYLSDVLYSQVFDIMLARFPSFRVVRCLSGEKALGGLPQTNWMAGRITKDVLEATESNLKLVLSGPMGLCECASGIWTSLGRRADAIHCLDSVPAEWIGQAPAPGNCRACLDTGMTGLAVPCICVRGEKKAGSAKARAAREAHIMAASVDQEAEGDRMLELMRKAAVEKKNPKHVTVEVEDAAPAGARTDGFSKRQPSVFRSLANRLSRTSPPDIRRTLRVRGKDTE